MRPAPVGGWSSRRIAAWVTAGAAGAGLVVAGVFGAKYISDTAKAEEHKGRSQLVYDYARARKTDTVVGVAALAAGVAAGAASAVLFLTGREQKGPKRVAFGLAGLGCRLAVSF